MEQKNVNKNASKKNVAKSSKNSKKVIAKKAVNKKTTNKKAVGQKGRKKLSTKMILIPVFVVGFAGEAPDDHSSSASDASIAKLEAKFDTVIGLLSQLVSKGDRPIVNHNIIDGRSVSNGLAPYMHEATNSYEQRQTLLNGGSII